MTQRSAQLNWEEGAAAARLGVFPASSNGVGFIQVVDRVEMRVYKPVSALVPGL